MRRPQVITAVQRRRRRDSTAAVLARRGAVTRRFQDSTVL
jgi:hypothetical protein